jgi:uncharacterized protein (TIGR03083 family)
MFKRSARSPGTIGVVEIAEHIAALRQHGHEMAAAADRAGLDAPVPPCAPWLVKDLLRHTGYIHRWAARHITECPAAILDGPSEKEILSGGAPDGELLAWFRDGHAALVETLVTADPGLQTATFIAAPTPLAFWARRQAHETAMHRADAEAATGTWPRFPADFAADGIDELIMGFGRRRKYQPKAGGHGTLQVLAGPDDGTGGLAGPDDGTGGLAGPDDGTGGLAGPDDGTGGFAGAWLADIRDGRIQPRRADGPPEPADCTVSGPAPGLYLFLWNRADADRAGVTIAGDPAVLDLWRSGVRVRWE